MHWNHGQELSFLITQDGLFKGITLKRRLTPNWQPTLFAQILLPTSESPGTLGEMLPSGQSIFAHKKQEVAIC